MSNKKSTTDVLMHQIRANVNQSIFVQNLQRHGFDWDMVCAAMDTIEDSQLAIQAFKLPDDDDWGTSYLTLYGLFQALFLQQDSCSNLAKGLNLASVNIWKDSDGAEVRRIRSSYFGHPTEYLHSGNRATYHGITRLSIGDGTIEGWTYPQFRTEDINIAEVVQRHEASTVRILAKINAELTNKGRSFMQSFTQPIPVEERGYQFEKIYSWVFRGTRDAGIFAESMLKIISDDLDKIEAAVKERFETADHVGDTIRDIKKARYCAKILRKGIAESKTDTASTFYYEVHAESLKKIYDSVRTHCIELNEKFTQGS